MLTNETINEMVRIIRASRRMCKEHPDCQECPAKVTSCEFTDYNKNMAELIRIIDRYDGENAEQKQQEEAEQQKDTGDEQSHSNNTLEGRVDHLEKCVREHAEKLSHFIHDTVEKIEEMDGHIAHQNAEKELRKQNFGVLPNIAKGSANTPPKKHTRLEILLRDFPNAMLCPDGSAFLRPCSVDTSYITSVCANQANCVECRRKYWNEQVEGI